MQQATATEHAPIDIVSGLAERLRSRFGEDGHLGDVADRLAEIDARLHGATTPRTAVHGDFWFGNVLVRGGELSGVVDWEAGSLSGEPAKTSHVLRSRMRSTSTAERAGADRSPAMPACGQSGGAPPSSSRSVGAAGSRRSSSASSKTG